MTRWLYLSVALTVLAAAAAGYLYVYQFDRLPEQVPTHWDVHGRPDAWTPREKAWPVFVTFPGLMALMIVLTLVLPWLSPKHFTVDEFRDTYGYVMMLLVVLMGYLGAVILAGAFHPEWDIIRPLVAGIFLFFALMGNVLGKVRRNFWMGVRTPWTIASETVWTQTHRVAAWLFVAAGLLGFAAVLAGVSLVACFVLLVAAALVPVIYSLVLYKRLERQGRL
jgi:uncharacterized membrane protein